MKVYLIQHGEAQSKEANPERPLTSSGIAGIQKMAAFICRHASEIQYIRHSEKLRARQTAELFAAKLGIDPAAVTEESGLTPHDAPELWADRLAEERLSVAIVGHMPHLVRLASLLVCGNPEEDIIRFCNAGVACLSADDPRDWSIEWVVVPAMLP